MSIELDMAVEKIVDAIEKNTDKLQEVLERIECIDNTFDDVKQTLTDSANEAEDYNDNITSRLDTIIQQGRP